jgi:type I restriction enzyme R subunit
LRSRQLRTFEGRLRTFEPWLRTFAPRLRDSKERGERLGLSPQEEAFYDALTDNESAVRAMGDAALRIVAQELATAMRRNTSVDWTIRDSVRARIRVVVKKILKAHGFPPDLQDAAVKLVLEQAETLCRDWTGE